MTLNQLLHALQDCPRDAVVARADRVYGVEEVDSVCVTHGVRSTTGLIYTAEEGIPHYIQETGTPITIIQLR